ncbi:hypothetical protein BT93_A1749 [Corymbia citriodora subsp. variegata]|nr:hypothetical protein BT93_A1749 [Corymbia citriodora subsp. variegata]
MAEEQENRRPNTPIIVAMKGHPGTGKSTLARALSSALKIPLLDKDDVRDCTLALQQRHQPPEDGLLNDLAYDVVFAVAATQLANGLSVVVDSPLSRRARLDHLVRLASSHGARVAVVECRPGDEAERIALRPSDQDESSTAVIIQGGGRGRLYRDSWGTMNCLNRPKSV